MGTEIIDKPRCYVKRYWGGERRGVCFSVKIDMDFEQRELVELISKILVKAIVSGEGKVKKK